MAAFLLILAVLSLTIGRDIYIGEEPDLVSFSISHFAGYLFFLVMPVEGLYVYYQTLEPNQVVLLAIALGTALSAQVIDYLCGYLVGGRVIQHAVRKERYEKAQVYIQRYGNWVILVFNLLPLSSPILILAAGMLRYPFASVLLYSFLGLLVKYGVLALFFI